MRVFQLAIGAVEGRRKVGMAPVDDMRYRQYKVQMPRLGRWPARREPRVARAPVC